MSQSTVRLSTSRVTTENRSVSSPTKLGGKRKKMPKSQEEIQLRSKYKVGAGYVVMLAGFAIINMAFIVPSLIYAFQNSDCVLTMVDTVQFNLKVWLEVDAFTKIALIVVIILIVIGMSFKKSKIVKKCVSSSILIYNIFSFAWIITGSAIFWGKLNPMGVCTGGIQAYMWSLLILSYLLIGFNCYINATQNAIQRLTQRKP